jgi:hypothetical protein
MQLKKIGSMTKADMEYTCGVSAVSNAYQTLALKAPSFVPMSVTRSTNLSPEPSNPPKRTQTEFAKFGKMGTCTGNPGPIVGTVAGNCGTCAIFDVLENCKNSASEHLSSGPMQATETATVAPGGLNCRLGTEELLAGQ